MKKACLLVFAVPLLVAALAGYPSAREEVDSMRCGSKLVQLGDTKIDVLASCGEPAMRDKIERSTTGGRTKKGPVEGRSTVDEQWTYNFGPQDFVYTLTFEGVELRSIVRGGRGTRR